MGRKPGISATEKRLRHEFAQALLRVIGEERGGQAKAARLLGVSRQCLNLYLKKRTTPGSEILRRACSLWALQLNLDGFKIGPDQFSSKQPFLASRQLSLFDAITDMDQKKIGIELIRKGLDSIDLKVSIKFNRAG
jgi:hypothetical protein